MKGVHHVEFSVLDFEESIKFYDKMFGWLGYKSFWTHDIGYLSTYYTAWFPFFHSYIGIQPAKSGGKLNFQDHATGIHHIALWAKSKYVIDDFYENFLLKNNIEVTDKPSEYPIYSPSYYAVFFNDPITGIHFELACTPSVANILGYFTWKKRLKAVWNEHSEWQGDPLQEMIRELPSRNKQKL